MVNRHFGVAVSAILCLFVGSSANAANFPAGYTTATCHNVCAEYNSSSLYFCDLAANGTTGGGDATAVFNFDGGSGQYDYSVWGTDGAGNTFACYTSDPDRSIVDLEVDGTSYGDTISFMYSSSIYLRRGSATSFVGSAYGLGGGDTIEGSPENESTDDPCDTTRPSYVYYEYLNGGGDSSMNVIYGNGGNDFLYSNGWDDYLDGGDQDDCLVAYNTYTTEMHGGAGDDQIFGGSGADTIYGEDGMDMISGGAGNDVVHGGALQDIINGGLGNDTMYGEGGSDIMCGGAGSGTDTFYGGAGDDYMWEGGVSGNPGGSDSGTNHCGSVLTYGHFISGCTAIEANPGC